MNRDVMRQIVNVITLVIMIVVNALANILPINGLTTAEISDSFPVFFVPAGYVFSIWGLIYVVLIAFVIYQALPAQRENPRMRRIGYLFALSSIANTAWIFLWHYQQFPLTLVAMITLLLSLIAIYLRLDVGRLEVSGGQKWLVNVPFSIYLGWITVATIANVTMVLYNAQWNGFGIAPESWAVIMLIIGTVVASLVIITRCDVAYTAVIVWAFIGIVVKQSDISNVALTAGIMTAVVIVVLVFKLFTDRGGSGRMTARAA
jgi:translocator protein